MRVPIAADNSHDPDAVFYGFLENQVVAHGKTAQAGRDLVGDHVPGPAPLAGRTEFVTFGFPGPGASPCSQVRGRLWTHESGRPQRLSHFADEEIADLYGFLVA